MSQPQLRQNKWLETQLFDIWENNFADVPRKNLVLIKFGKASKRQLGSIKWAHKNSKIKTALKQLQTEHEVSDDKRISIITITKHFAHPDIPEDVVKATIAHELVHYTHGFHSPLPKLFSHPHRGSIVKKELIKRDLGDMYLNSEVWLKKGWVKFLRKYR
jgi:hypothetical protein